MKLATYIHYVSRHWWKCFGSQRSGSLVQMCDL